GIQLTFRRGDSPVFGLPVRPSELGRPFTIYVSLLNPGEFHRLFQEGLIPSPSWDSLTYSRLPSDKLSAPPAKVELHRVRCVNPQIFSEADPALVDLDNAELIPAELFKTPVRTGYAIVRSGVNGGPKVTARVVRGTGTYQDVAVQSPAAHYEISLP